MRPASAHTLPGICCCPGALRVNGSAGPHGDGLIRMTIVHQCHTLKRVARRLLNLICKIECTRTTIHRICHLSLCTLGATLVRCSVWVSDQDNVWIVLKVILPAYRHPVSPMRETLNTVHTEGKIEDCCFFSCLFYLPFCYCQNCVLALLNTIWPRCVCCWLTLPTNPCPSLKHSLSAGDAIF